MRERIYEYSTLAIANDSLTIQHHRRLVRLRAKLAYSGALMKWRVRSRPLFHALSRRSQRTSICRSVHSIRSGIEMRRALDVFWLS